ncbi:hypothetical protein JCM10449v2_005540 [Rhodotorula kratochvilovae]
MILKGCSGMCWLACGLQSAVVPLAVIVASASVGAATAASSTTGTGTSGGVTLNEKSLEKAYSFWGLAVLLCWLASMAVGLFVICTVRPFRSPPHALCSPSRA